MWPTRHTVCLVMRSDRSMLPHIHVVYSPTLSPAGIIMKSNYDTLSFSALVIKRSYFEVRRPIRWYRYVSGLHIRLLNTFPDIFCSYRHAFATTFFFGQKFWKCHLLLSFRRVTVYRLLAARWRRGGRIPSPTK